MGDIVEPGSFRAFLSYSHVDERAARRLHRALETYRLPRRLRAGADGRLTPIFRDRDELPAGEDLSATIRSALARSEALIVLCSPAARASQWVGREIELFRQLHPDRPIFAALIEGEPADVFPEALRADPAREPIAADFRKQGDGRRLALLKLVAGLASVELDALVQRDAQRQVRRVTTVTLIALAAVLVMAALLVIALNARREADRQRREAEGLVEFMLTDLRTKLKGVGSIDVRRAVNRRAVAYYGDSSALAVLPDDSIERRARILHAMGEDDVTAADLSGALARFREAYAATAAVLRRHPDQPSAIFAHAQSEYWIGSVHEQRGEWGEAERHYHAYADGAAKLIALEPGNPDYMMEMGYAASNLGTVQLNGIKNPVAAESFYRDAVRWFQRAAEKTPRNADALRNLGNAYAWLADSFYARRMWTESYAARRAEYAINQKLYAADPDNADKAYVLAIAERALSRHPALLSDPKTASDLLLSAYRRVRALVLRDPANTEWARFAAKVECDMLMRDDELALPVSAAVLRRDIEASRILLRSAGVSDPIETAKCTKSITAIGRGG